MKLIKLSAYMQLNLGDDLMVDQLLKRYPDYTFYDWLPGNKKPIFLQNRNFFNVEDVYSAKILGKLNRIADILTLNKKRGFFFRWVFSLIERRCCTSVSIGGSLFRQNTNETVEKRINRDKRRFSKNNQHYIIGANFGPYKDEEYRKAFHEFFETCAGVSFRDSYSYNLFKEIPHVQWTSDVVFSIPDRCTDENDNIVISVLGFSHHPELQFVKEQYVKFLSDACIATIEMNKKPILVSFCEFEGDSETISCVLENLDSSIRDKVEICVYNGNVESILDLFAKSRFIIASRFHSMILGLRYSKKMFTISYECKTENVLNDLGIKSWCRIEDVQKVQIDEVFSIGAHPVECEEYIQASQLQFAQLDKALRSR